MEDFIKFGGKESVMEKPRLLPGQFPTRQHRNDEILLFPE